MRLLCCILLTAFSISACSDGEDSGAKEADDARDIAMVEAAQSKRAPTEDLIPQPILASDLDEKDLFGGQCAMQHPSGIHYLAVAKRDDAWIKLDDQLLRFGPDKGSPEQPFETWVNYDGREYSMRLRIIDEIDGASASGEYPGELVIRDTFDREVFELTGTIECIER